MDDAAIFTRFHEAWTDGDIDTVLELADPDVVARPVHGVLFTKSEYHGHEGLRSWFREMTAPWESFEARVEEVHSTDDGVVGFLHLIGHRDDGLFDARVASFCEIRDGRISSLVARDIWDAKEELGV